MWNTAYEILGSKKNLNPTQLIIDGKICSNPQKMATEFNQVFSEKVKKLKSELAGPVTIDPAELLRSWQSKRSEAITELDEIP